MTDDGFDTKELDELVNKLLRLTNDLLPKETKNFMNREGYKLAKQARANYKSAIKQKKTGNLLKGIKRGRPYLYNGEEYQVRVKNTAPHAWLFEHGHMVKLKNGREKHVGGTNVMAKTYKAFATTFKEDAEQFINELIEKGQL